MNDHMKEHVNETTGAHRRSGGMRMNLRPWIARLSAVVGLAWGCTVWAQQPIPPKAVWTPTAKAPDGMLTALEGTRHDRSIERAQKGNIDIVFFGSTDTEMWSWPDRGLSVWNQAFGSRNAANFGSQGTRPESLLWRMRNGELDGYQAKVVVLQSFTIGDNAIPADHLSELLASYTAVISEIQARQPQAKILLFAAFPRGRLRREPWRQVSAANASALAKLVDDKTVFYVDIGDRFFLPDGSHNQEMWYLEFPNAGFHEPGFKVWAEELQPWLDRFAR